MTSAQKAIEDQREIDFQYYLQNHAQWATMYGEGTYVAIKNKEVIGGPFASFSQAVSEISRTYERGTFLVQRCVYDLNDVTHYYHSPRVRLATK